MKEEDGVVMEKELLAWELCNLEDVLGPGAVALWSSRYGLFLESLLSSGERSGNCRFTGKAVADAIHRSDLPLSHSSPLLNWQQLHSGHMENSGLWMTMMTKGM